MEMFEKVAGVYVLPGAALAVAGRRGWWWIW